MSYNNPYQSYGQPPSYGSPGQYGPPPVDPTKINAPAIGLISVGAINLLHSLFSLVMNLSGANAAAPPPPNLQNNPQAMEMYNSIMQHQGTINVVVGALALICSALIIGGGVMMLQRKAYPLCVTASILAAIPCLSFLACCAVGGGIGIWALVILMAPDVKRAFQ